MSKQLIPVVVATLGVERRCRAGHCFSRQPVTVEVTDKQLRQLNDDPYLQVESSAFTSDQDDAIEALAEKLTANGHVQSDKKLSVKICEKLVGFDVSADIRDAAWALLPTEKQQPDDKSKDGE